MDEITVSRLMSSRVEFVSRDATLAEAATLMHEHRHSCLVVADDDLPVGIITERDMVGALSKVLCGDSLDGMVEACMSAPAVTVREDASHHDVITMSCGIATVREPSAFARGWASVVKLADKALYQAKASGKNTLVVHKQAQKAAA